ncbi:MAG: ABC transporter ATP-binding protein [Armatimonadetes bacterium]|nr:ABC transporter ATP-binding protein [Armatimonadota bacterium]
MSDAAIQLQDVSKRFRLAHHPVATLKGAVASFWKRRFEDLWALKSLSLEVPRGQTLAVVGRNGSGKSTLLGLIGRIYLPTAGHIEIHGRVAALLELGAGFHPDLTGEQNVLLNGVILGMRERDVRKSLDDIIHFAELEKFRDAPLRSYSAGMTMRLGFAVAVFTDPQILLIDEVLAVGDQAFQAKCLREIQRFQESGRTIVFVSHDLDTVRRVSGRAIWLHEGALRADGDPEAVVKEYLSATA